jgi:hypothetical protein
MKLWLKNTLLRLRGDGWKKLRIRLWEQIFGFYHNTLRVLNIYYSYYTGPTVPDTDKKRDFLLFELGLWQSFHFGCFSKTVTNLSLRCTILSISFNINCACCSLYVWKVL